MIQLPISDFSHNICASNTRAWKFVPVCVLLEKHLIFRVSCGIVVLAVQSNL